MAEREAAKRASNIAGGGGGGGAGNLVRGGNKEADTGKAPSRNPFLTDIFKDLWPMYVRLREARTDAEECKTGEHENEIEGGLRAEFLTGEKVEKNTATSASTAPMDGYLLYMLALVVRALHKQGGVSAVFRACECTGEEELGGVPSAKELYVRSLQLVPYNWSCWLDLASLCVEVSYGPASLLLCFYYTMITLVYTLSPTPPLSSIFYGHRERKGETGPRGRKSTHIRMRETCPWYRKQGTGSCSSTSTRTCGWSNRTAKPPMRQLMRSRHG